MEELEAGRQRLENLQRERKEALQREVGEADDAMGANTGLGQDAAAAAASSAEEELQRLRRENEELRKEARKRTAAAAAPTAPIAPTAAAARPGALALQDGAESTDSVANRLTVIQAQLALVVTQHDDSQLSVLLTQVLVTVATNKARLGPTVGTAAVADDP